MWWARCVTQRYVKRNGGISTRGIGRISLVGSSGSAFQRNSVALPASKARKIIYAGISTRCHTTILISYQDNRILLIKQVMTESFASQSYLASSRHAVRCSEAIWNMKA